MKFKDPIGLRRFGGSLHDDKNKLKRYLLLCFIILLIILIWFFNKEKLIQNKNKDFSILNYQLQSNSYKLLVADTPEKWGRGLMFLRKLEGVDGMIFIFPDKQSRTFWNKNTLIDLDILWIDGEKVVGKSFLPSIEKSKEIVTVESPKSADKVIEIPAKK